MLAQYHAQAPCVGCVLCECDCGQCGVVHCGVRLPYSVETDPATQSTTQTPAIVRENLARLLSVHFCKNTSIIYLSPYDPPSNWNDLLSPKT